MKNGYKSAVKAAKQRMLSGYNQVIGGTDNNDTKLTIDKKKAKFLKKVLDIVNSDDVVINPIGKLMDKKLFDKMDDTEKSRYVLEMSREYLDAKEFIAKNELTADGIDIICCESKSAPVNR